MLITCCLFNKCTDILFSSESEDPESSSLKPFDLLGTEGGSKGVNLFEEIFLLQLILVFHFELVIEHYSVEESGHSFRPKSI